MTRIFHLPKPVDVDQLVREAPASQVSVSGAERRAEILRLDEDIRALNGAVEKFITLAGLAIGALITVGLINKQVLVSMLAPYGISVLLVYLLQIYTDVESRIVLRAYLEKVESRAEKKLISLQPIVVDAKYRNRLSVQLVGVMYGIFMVGVIVNSIVSAARGHVFWVFQVLHYVGVVVLLVNLGAAYLELQYAGRGVLGKIKRANQEVGSSATA
jgi:hypothetical protein